MKIKPPTTLEKSQAIGREPLVGSENVLHFFIFGAPSRGALKTYAHSCNIPAALQKNKSQHLTIFYIVYIERERGHIRDSDHGDISVRVYKEAVYTK